MRAAERGENTYDPTQELQGMTRDQAMAYQGMKQAGIFNPADRVRPVHDEL